MNQASHQSLNWPLNRRHFMGAAFGASFALPSWAQATGRARIGEILKIGLISDVHKDIMHDADTRLETFVDAMTSGNVDALLQIGDFCTPIESNKQFLAIYNRFDGPRYHVLGNHDTDGGFDRADAVKFLGMPSRYYSFDQQGFHFIVLDANDVPDGNTETYPSYIARDQQEWLENDLAKTELTVFVFVHQSLERESDITGGADIRRILEQARLPDRSRKVAAVFNGHHHMDHARIINGIPYIHINSASYYWVGEKFSHLSYSKEIHEKHDRIRKTAPYKDPLYTTLLIDPQLGRFSLAGASSDWQGFSPKELGFGGRQVANGWVNAKISARSVQLPK